MIRRIIKEQHPVYADAEDPDETAIENSPSRFWRILTLVAGEIAILGALLWLVTR